MLHLRARVCNLEGSGWHEEAQTKPSSFESLGTKRRRVDVGEAKIGSLGINRSCDQHVGGIPSNLPEKLNRRFILQLFETSGG